MPHIVLTEEQARTYYEAEHPIQIRDQKGKIVAYIQPDFRPETAEEAQERTPSSRPNYTSEQVRAMLRALETEWERTGGFDKPYMKTFLEKWDAEGRR